jgi:glycosyltransferase involved in cell wall biosynthesis
MNLQLDEKPDGMVALATDDARKARVAVVMVTTDSHAPYICEAIRSVQAQTLAEWELVIQDDGPRGLAGEAAAELVKNDERISYALQENAGIWNLAHTYNRALEKTSAPFIAILESDDYWPADKLQTQVEALENSDAVLSYGLVQHVSSDGAEHFDCAPHEELQKRADVLANRPIGRATLAMSYEWQFVSPASIVIRRASLEEIGGFQFRDYYPSTDFPTVLELSLRGAFDFHARVMGFGRRHQSSATARTVTQQTYIPAMFRCWREAAEQHDLLIPRDEYARILHFWHGRLSECFWLVARRELQNGNTARARQLLRAASPHLSHSTRNMAKLARLFSRLPFAHSLAEQLYRVLGKETIDDLRQATDDAQVLVDEFENWVQWLKQRLRAQDEWNAEGELKARGEVVG